MSIDTLDEATGERASLVRQFVCERGYHSKPTSVRTPHSPASKTYLTDTYFKASQQSLILHARRTSPLILRADCNGAVWEWLHGVESRLIDDVRFHGSSS